ncbi:CHAD domain-containing protein [Pseudomonas sp. stari2]|uniref:CHAD domain-containing protein n=1 Tax=Pseudomonas sp. Stari2 TaxID=2954814 RepID=UPI00345CD740
MARLEAQTDHEALHDLRIAVRRIRSLMRPFRAIPQVLALNGLVGNFMSDFLSAEQLEGLHAYWRAANYLAVGQIYLKDNVTAGIRQPPVSGRCRVSPCRLRNALKRP